MLNMIPQYAIHRNTQYYTIRSKSEKAFRFILRGLHDEIYIDTITRDVKAKFFNCGVLINHLTTEKA